MRPLASSAVLALALGAAASALGQAAPVKLMPLGDSITAGLSTDGTYNNHGGYRKPMADLLGSGYDFVGSQTTYSGPTVADKQHEGYSGYHILKASNPGNGDLAGRVGAAPSLAQNAVNTYTPDVVLLHIGTNDLLGSDSAATASQDFDVLLGQIFAARPQVRVVAAPIIPLNQSARSPYNYAIQNIARKYKAAGRSIDWAGDMQFDVPSSDLPDSVHPNAAGYAKMATVWNAALTGPAPTAPTQFDFASREDARRNFYGLKPPANLALESLDIADGRLAFISTAKNREAAAYYNPNSIATNKFADSGIRADFRMVLPETDTLEGVDASLTLIARAALNPDLGSASTSTRYTAEIVMDDMGANNSRGPTDFLTLRRGSTQLASVNITGLQRNTYYTITFTTENDAAGSGVQLVAKIFALGQSGGSPLMSVSHLDTTAPILESGLLGMSFHSGVRSDVGGVDIDVDNVLLTVPEPATAAVVIPLALLARRCRRHFSGESSA